MSEPQQLDLDPYVTDVLMRDLAGHDRSPAAFLVYLWLWRHSRAEGRQAAAASLQTIAAGTGLSKSAVQRAVGHLRRRGLLTDRRDSATATPFYRVAAPWRRDEA